MIEDNYLFLITKTVNSIYSKLAIIDVKKYSNYLLNYAKSLLYNNKIETIENAERIFNNIEIDRANYSKCSVFIDIIEDIISKLR